MIWNISLLYFIYDYHHAYLLQKFTLFLNPTSSLKKLLDSLLLLFTLRIFPTFLFFVHTCILPHYFRPSLHCTMKIYPHLIWLTFNVTNFNYLPQKTKFITYVWPHFLLSHSSEKIRTPFLFIVQTHCYFFLSFLNSIFLHYLSVSCSTLHSQTVSFASHTGTCTHVITGILTFSSTKVYLKIRY